MTQYEVDGRREWQKSGAEIYSYGKSERDIPKSLHENGYRDSAVHVWLTRCRGPFLSS